MGYEHEEVIDTRSGFAFLLVKWKVVVIAALIAGILGCVFGYVKAATKPAETVLSYEERVEKARKALSEDSALYVEQLHGQYTEYGKLLGEWNAYMETSALQSLDPANYVRRDILYVLESNSPNAVSAFSSSLMGKTEFEKMAEGMDWVSSPDAIGELVEVSDASAVNQTGLTPGQQRFSDFTVEGYEGEEFTGYRSTMNIRFLAGSEEEADVMGKVIEDRVRERVSQMQKSSVSVKAVKAGETTLANDSKWLVNMQQTAVTPMITLQTNRSNFIKNSVDVLDDKEQAYLNLLNSEESASETAAVTKTSSVKKSDLIKYGLIAAIAGAVLALAWLLLIFVFSDKIMGEEQLKDNFGLPVLQRFVVEGSGKSPKKADALKRKGLSTLVSIDSAESVERGGRVLAYELKRRLGGEAGRAKVFIACDNSRNEIRETVEALVNYLRGQGIAAAAGIPSENDMDFQDLLSSEAAIIATTMNVSRTGTLKNMRGICQRNNIKIFGCVTLIDTSKY